MGGQLRPEEVARARAGIEGVLDAVTSYVGITTQILRDLEYASGKFPASVYLHDEIATAEELHKMLSRVEIHELTQEEWDDR